MVTYKKDWKASKRNGLSKEHWTQTKIYMNEDNDCIFIVVKMEKYNRKPIYISVSNYFGFEKYKDRAFITIDNSTMTGGQGFTDKEYKIVNRAFDDIVKNYLFKEIFKKHVIDDQDVCYEILDEEFQRFIACCKMRNIEKSLKLLEREI